MKFSASSINTLSKCGYKYYLTKIQGQQEPGKRSYAMLQGDIVGDAIQEASLHLNKYKELTYESIAAHLYNAYESRFRQAEIAEDLLPYIRSLLTEGVSPDTMNMLDVLSESINCSPNYQFPVPPPLKKGGKKGYSEDKKRLGMCIIKTYEDLVWFFNPAQPHYAVLRDAVSIVNEKYFTIPIGEPYTVSIAGQTIEEQDMIDGYFDQLVHGADGKIYIHELKYVSSPYSQRLVDGTVQLITYALAIPDAEVKLFDVKSNRAFTADIRPEMHELTLQRYLNGRKMVQNQIYIPACGTDNYTTKNQLCGFKCGGCPYGVAEEEGASSLF